MEILVNVVGQKLKAATNQKTLVAGTQEFIKFVFELPDDWKDLKTFVQFRQSENVYEKYLDKENSVYLPSEIAEGICVLALQGNLGNVIAKSATLSFFVDKDPIKDGATGTEITLTLYEQLCNEVHEIGKMVGYGTGNEFYGNTESTKDSNKLGTRGFEIISYSGAQGESGTYTVRGTGGDYNDLKAVFGTGEELYITILNKENKDSWCKITAVSFDSNNIVITVDNIYTNSTSVSYDASATYNKTGIVTWAPELGWTIQQREAGNADWQEQACFFICGHPELGTFSWFGSQSAFGDGNILQGKTSAAIGLNNRIYGKYGFAAGKNNKVGYNGHAFGQDIDFSKAQGAFGAGKNLYADRDAHPIMFGQNLRAAKSNKSVLRQLIAGFFNKNKPRNVFEVGAGHSEALRKNAFEVDRDGQVFANEKFLPLQCITQQNTTFSETEREQKITNVSSQVTFRSPSGLGIREEKTSAAYGPYVYVHAQKAGLTVGKWYVMAVGITNYSDNWKVSVRGYVKVDSETEKEYGFASDEISVSKGECYILCPIYAERLDSSYGF